MNSQQVITKLLVQMILQEQLKNRNETKIFIPSSFAHRLERELRIKTYKDIQFGGYRIVCGPFSNISAYNKVHNVELVMTLQGEIIQNPT